MNNLFPILFWHKHSTIKSSKDEILVPIILEKDKNNISPAVCEHKRKLLISVRKVLY